MAWQILAMWSIVLVTIVWFMRDEKRLRHDAKLEAAARYYAHAPKYRHISVDDAFTTPMPTRRVGGLSESQRAYMQGMAQQD